MSADGVGQTASNAGAKNTTPGMLAPQAPTGSDPDKSLSPPEQFRSLKATLQALEVLREGDLRATLRFENIDSNMRVALAHRAENSVGIADLWKIFPPTPIGLVTDDRGNHYSLSKQSPLGFARNGNDWVVLKGGEMATHTFVFEGNSSGAPGSTFTVSMDLHVVTGPHERPDIARWSLVFTDVIP